MKSCKNVWQSCLVVLQWINAAQQLETELKERHCIEDALNATRAVQEGFVAGGGTALVNAISAAAELSSYTQNW